MSLKFAPTKRIDKHKRNVRRILVLIGQIAKSRMSEVFVSDYSALWDFSLTKSQMKQLSKSLGFAIRASDYVVDVAIRIKRKKQRDERKSGKLSS